MKILSLLALLVVLLCSIAPGQAQQPVPEPLGLALENFSYPYPVRYLSLAVQNEQVRMAYMDVQPARANGKTVLLLHGKNFFGAYWEQTIRFLSEHGFRVVVPDQIGFGKSSKPAIDYSFHLLARTTKTLLDSLGISRTTVVGHSMGGMLATRFALMYPNVATHLVLENPIGLEDYRISVPYVTVEEAFRGEMKATEQSIRNYHRTYYPVWKPEYDIYVQTHYRWTLGAEYPRLAWVAALTSDMIYTQPVVYEFPYVRVPALVVIGQQDRTTIGRDRVSADILATLGRYPELGKKTAAAIPNAQLVELEQVGHIPHLEATEQFNTALLGFLLR